MDSRIARSATSADWIAFGPFVLFPGQRTLKRDGHPVPIADKIWELLLALLERRGEVLTKAELAERVWRRKLVEDVNLRVAVAKLRRRLGRTAEGGDYILNAMGRGYAFSSAVPVDYWPRAAPNAPEGAATLPRLLKPVFGRAQDVDRIGQLLERHRLVTIAGPGGVGKTTVAIAIASRIDGASFIDFASICDPALVPARVADALSWLAHERPVLIFDNCEHLAQAIAERAEAILREVPQVRILATSREPLRAEAETVFRLEALDCPREYEAKSAVAALGFPAVQLFVERAMAADVRFALTDGNAATVAEICRRLDGMALAIQLAAGRVGAFGVDGIASRLDHLFPLLDQGQRTAPARHQTLEASIAWSFDLLTEVERAVFIRLAPLPLRFTLDAAISVAGGAEGDVIGIIGRLVEKSLLAREGPSYRMSETVRRYARDRWVGGAENGPGAAKEGMWRPAAGGV